MRLINKIEEVIWEMFPKSKYMNVGNYITRWHKTDEQGWWENFSLFFDDNGNINLNKTLNSMDGELLLKIAIDLGIDTPYFIPCIPSFKNTLKDRYQSAYDTFNKAITNIEDAPDISIGLANSALESITKNILNEGLLTVSCDKKDTLYKLTQQILKGFDMYPTTTIPQEIKTLGSSLLGASKAIEDLRSDKTSLHGAANTDYIITDKLYAYFIVNAVISIGLFIDSYYKLKFIPQRTHEQEQCQNASTDNFIDDLPF